MRYLGGKQRLGPTIASYVNILGGLYGARSYCEPFVGMGGVARHVTIPDRWLGDIKEDLVLFLRAVRDGWTPPTTLTKDEYNTLRIGDPSPIRAFAGFGCSFGGKWFGGYARTPGGTRNYAAEQSRDAVKLGKALQSASIECLSYLDAPDADVTYCDPPYAGTTGYHGTDSFDHGQFWEWVRARPGLVLVSEYTGPDWAEVVWSKPVKTTIKQAAGVGSAKNDRVEKLFAKWPD